MRKLGQVERRWSYASWTSPSHFNLLMGLLPHASPKHVFASEFYTKDFFKYNERLGVHDIEFKSLVPKLNLPSFLKDSLGYTTNAMVSLPVLNPQTILNHGFDTYFGRFPGADGDPGMAAAASPPDRDPSHTHAAWLKRDAAS